MNGTIIKLINQYFEVRTKITDMGNASAFERNFNRFESLFEEENHIVKDPTGETYTESRTDCEASIVGKVSAKMTITKTLKPIVYEKSDGGLHLVQKAVVIVE